MLIPLVRVVCLFLSIKFTSCGLNSIDLEYLKDLWLMAIKKSNESFLKQSLYDDDYQHLIDVLSDLKRSQSRSNVYEDIQTAILKNSYEKIFGFKIGMFTNFCGPGDRGQNNQTVGGFLNGVDECCKSHDHCDNLIMAQSDYSKYPNLPPKHLYFTSLSCDCDAEFYNCVKRTKSVYGEIILAIYSVAQMSCFHYEHKVEKCLAYDK
ncbi:CLUMA_CG014860, isoform A [Clunio marinus]|uniref:phospholipase A2 n=1 Tax=Clunio marinus TaxID=568069 RepID=A0A1J1IN36_9DIPT|nr:CLUMA_CG014860, isoform A [Clunio marinus]